MNLRSGTQLPNAPQPKYPKNDTRYWQGVVFKAVNADGIESPHYSMRIQFKGTRLSFGTGTGNKDQASKIAKGIYVTLIEKGLEAALAKHRPKAAKAPKQIATVGEFLAAAEAVSTVDANTFASYARCLRSVVAQIAATERTKGRFFHGNAAKYRQTVDAVSLAILTEEAVQKWRKQFVAGKKQDPASQKTARISCNSVLRQAKNLFSEKKVLKYLSLILPIPVPLLKAEFFPRDSMKYQSEIEAKDLLQTAVTELRAKQPEVYKVILLALGAGLRRNEIDKLKWSQIGFARQVIDVKVTVDARVKSLASEGKVFIDDFVCDELKKLRAVAKSPFVIEGPVTTGKKSLYLHEVTLSRAVAWLRKYGLKASKPIHSLRKEAGSLVNEAEGIHAASGFLRHESLQVTVAHYSDHRKKVKVNMSGLIAPEAKKE